LKKTKKKPLTRRDVELLDGIIAALSALMPLFSTSPQSIAKQLRDKFVNKRRKVSDRFSMPFVLSYHFGYNPKSLREFDGLIVRFARNKRLGNEYDKRRMMTLRRWNKSLLKNCLDEAGL